MRAAVVREIGQAPAYGEFDEPVAGSGETVVTVHTASVSQLVLSRASGRHSSAASTTPFVPGIDGVGTTPDERRVYFTFPRSPYGSLAERAPVRTDRLLRVPDEIDDATAAAAGVPGISCWIPLRHAAQMNPNEAVLVNGATGASGHIAVQVAKYFGASCIIATGRSEKELGALSRIGADVLLPIGPSMDAFGESVRRLAREERIGTIIDYLWGPTAEAILSALGGPDAPRGSKRVRFVQVGSLSAPAITLVSAPLRSSGIEIWGSGLGSSTDDELQVGIGEFLRAFASAGFRLESEVHSLSEIEQVWGRTGGARRIVFRVG